MKLRLLNNRTQRQLRLARLGRGIGHRRRFRTVTELAASRVETLRGPDGDVVVTRPELASSDMAGGAANGEQADG